MKQPKLKRKYFRLEQIYNLNTLKKGKVYTIRELKEMYEISTGVRLSPRSEGKRGFYRIINTLMNRLTDSDGFIIGWELR